jgi:hypothetical protein
VVVVAVMVIEDGSDGGVDGGGDGGSGVHDDVI